MGEPGLTRIDHVHIDDGGRTNGRLALLLLLPSRSPPSAYGVRDMLCAESTALEPSRRLKRGAIILEAMDNVDYHVDDIHGEGRYNVVQRVEATKRLCSLDAQGNHAYLHFSVRRLRNFNRTPDVLQRVRRFCEDNEGRPMDGSVFYVLSFINPRLYEMLRPSRFARCEVSCSELVVELYQRLGLVQRMWRWVPLNPQESAAFVQAAQYSSLCDSTSKGSDGRGGSLSLGHVVGRVTATPWNRLMKVFHHHRSNHTSDPMDRAYGCSMSDAGRGMPHNTNTNSIDATNRRGTGGGDESGSTAADPASSWSREPVTATTSAAAEMSVQHAWSNFCQSTAHRPLPQLPPHPR